MSELCKSVVQFSDYIHTYMYVGTYVRMYVHVHTQTAYVMHNSNTAYMHEHTTAHTLIYIFAHMDTLHVHVYVDMDTATHCSTVVW